MSRLFGRVAALCLCLASASCYDCNPASPSDPQKSGQQVWVSPNVASRDFLNLFLEPDAWREARTKVTTIGFFDSQLRYDACDLCGPNTIDNFLHVIPGGAFRWLAAHRLGTAVEAGAIKVWDCTAELNTSFVLQAVGNVEGNGGAVHFVALDEPLASAIPFCHETVDQAAGFVRAYVERVRAAYPAVQIGLIEPYPFLSIRQIESFIDALGAAGTTVPFFHLDFDPSSPNVTVVPDLHEIQSFCRARNIAFGVIIIGSNGSSSAAAVAGAMDFAAGLSQKLGIRSQDHVLFESWLDEPSARGERDLRFYPDNLPESNATTMMGLVNYVVDNLP
jgi:hypothetical protein